VTNPSPGYIEVSDDKECDEEEGEVQEKQDDDYLPEKLQTQHTAYEDVINDGDGEEEYLAQSLPQPQQLQIPQNELEHENPQLSASLDAILNMNFDLPPPQPQQPQIPQNELEHENPQLSVSLDAILNMDFDLPPPEGGWDNTMSPTPTLRARRHQAPTSLDTQAILSVETQPLDLSLPEPEGGFTQSRSLSAAPPSSPPLPAESNSTSYSIWEIRSLERERQQRSAAPLPPATYSPEETEEDEEEADPDPPLDGPSISAFLTRMVSKGYIEDNVISALRMTSTRGHLASLIIPTLSSGARLKDQRGVWTEQDDHDLEGGDGRGIKRVEEKHGWSGWGGCEERLEFLRMVRELED